MAANHVNEADISTATTATHTKEHNMNTRRKTTTVLTLTVAVMAGVILTSATTQAALIISNDFQTPETPYVVASGDLLEAATISAQSGWTAANGSDYNKLTDGAYGSVCTGGAIAIDGAWDDPAATATITYDLDLSGAAAGYDITSIVSYAGWSSASLGQQVITVEVSTVGDAGFSSLGTGTNQPAPDSVSTRVTYEDNTSPGTALIASGVDAVRFSSGDWTVFREFDAIGTATVIPEPTTFALAIMGLLGLVSRRR